MIKATDAELLEVVKKYKKQLVDKFLELASEDYEAGEGVKEVDILDEMLCIMDDEDFIADTISCIEDSVGMDSYGFIPKE